MKKYMIIERFKPELVKELYSRFEEQGRMLPTGVNFIDSWIDENVLTCFQLMETDSVQLIHQWVTNWNDLADFEIVPIIDSATAKQIALSNN